MTDLRIRAAGPDGAEDVLAFWKQAAGGTSVRTSPRRSWRRPNGAASPAAGAGAMRWAWRRTRGRSGQRAWAAARYHREGHWRRWVKPLA
ncbi:hypothetical protein ACFWAO_36850 [Streptomyces sp. NPDC059981]|uniref:hypothetical protein n=1 Tax=Streptomyces sp. NPDC059981 TaxID=3347023 RepID=UPI0036B4761E